MADKMMRIAGRDNNGRAKPIKTDELGNIGVQLSKSIGEIVTDTFVTFDEGSSIDIFDGEIKNVSDFKQIMLTIYGGSSYNCRAEFDWYNTTYNTYRTYRDRNDFNEVNDVCVENRVKSERLKITVTNTGASTVLRVVTVTGVR